MSKRFTSWCGALAFALGLAGCVSTGTETGTEAGAVGAAGPDAVETTANAEPTPERKERRWLPRAGSVFGGRDAEPKPDDVAKRSNLPKVNGRNAAAFEEAVSLMKAERWGDAESVLRRITEDQPELAGPWVNLGQVYLQLEQPEEARIAFREAIAANPENCAAYNQLGVLFRTQGQFTEAEAQYLKCLSGTPDFAEVVLNLGILYELYLGRLPEALAAYRKYQILIPEPDRKVAGWVMDLERRTRN